MAHRLACNRYLADAVRKWAFASLRRSAWAREFNDAQRARGKIHHTALRALGNRWLENLWHCLTHNVPYDETVHIASRNRALATIAPVLARRGLASIDADDDPLLAREVDPAGDVVEEPAEPDFTWLSRHSWAWNPARWHE